MARLAELKEESQKIKAKMAELRNPVTPIVKLSPSQRQRYEEACLKTESLNVRAREQRREAEEKLRQLHQEAQADAQDLCDLQERGDDCERKLEAMAAEKL